MSKAQWTVPVENYYQKEVVRRSVEDGTAFNAAYAIMNALAVVVASYGLLEDSPAVVIGAMVIATLLGPITGLALALVDGETALLRRALLAELAGGAIVPSIAFDKNGRICPKGRQMRRCGRSWLRDQAAGGYDRFRPVDVRPLRGASCLACAGGCFACWAFRSTWMPVG